ncbi:MarR family winged helix-turn-helix transcriptional regulator [Novosphingobium bradum]|uniref:MarR family winged helix-turn-helix transcriptional regulator n=1 Tax=Novosphingobium bradum TaxID=1737444 RepID=A0ABV7IMG5_9SPHN
MTAPNSPLSDFLPYLLSVTASAVSDRIAEEYRARFGIRIPEWRVLVVLGDAGPRTQRDLVRATLMDKVAVNRAAKALEARGLAVRRANTRDGRSHHLELTPDGRSVHARIMPLALEMERGILGALDEEERRTLVRLLGRVRQGAEFSPAGEAGAGLTAGPVDGLADGAADGATRQDMAA